MSVFVSVFRLDNRSIVAEPISVSRFLIQLHKRDDFFVPRSCAFISINYVQRPKIIFSSRVIRGIKPFPENRSEKRNQLDSWLSIVKSGISFDSNWGYKVLATALRSQMNVSRSNSCQLLIGLMKLGRW